MIDPFTIALLAVATITGLLAVVLGLAGRAPNDLTVLATGLVGVLLLAQVVIALIAPAVGNEPTGSLPEFWVYLVSACVVPPAAIAWALSERSRWSNVVLGVGALAIAVMVYRMNQIWNVQLA